MITQGATGTGFPKVRGRGVRPAELFLLTEKDLRRQSDSLPRRQRRREVKSEEAFESLPDLFVLIIASLFRQVPQPQTEKKRRRSPGFIDEIENLVEIGVELFVPGCNVIAVQGKIDLAKSRAG